MLSTSSNKDQSNTRSRKQWISWLESLTEYELEVVLAYLEAKVELKAAA